ncbi:ABC transporter permease [Candidatus Hydrogenedentota bacterium]
MKTYIRQIGAFAPVLTFLTLFILFSLISDTFFTKDNIFNIFEQISALAIMAVGVTFVLLCAEIDLSIENMAIFSGVFAAFLFGVMAKGNVGSPGFLSQCIPIVVAVGAAGALGFVSGLCTARLGLPSFMMTLAMFLVTKGLSLRITRGRPIFDIPPFLSKIGSGTLGILPYTDESGVETFLIAIPIITVVAVVFLAAGFVVLRYTRFGREVYLVGGNRKAAELAGINVKGVITACLCICGFTAGLSGVVLIGRLGSAQAGGLEDMLIGCISAVVLGGTSLFGGKGGIPNTVIGLLTFGVLYNGLNHVEIDIYLKQFISGLILLGALILNVTMARLRTADGSPSP